MLFPLKPSHPYPTLLRISSESPQCLVEVSHRIERRVSEGVADVEHRDAALHVSHLGRRKNIRSVVKRGK